MGMYTGLRFKGTVKPEYREMIERIHHQHSDWEQETQQYPFLKPFSQKSRCFMIPHGGLSYMPDSWDDDSIETEGFYNSYNYDTGYWAFQCSLKNYSNEISNFMEEVVPVIMEEVEHFESYYEEWTHSLIFEFKNGKFEQKTGKKYGYEYDGPWMY